MNRVVLCLLLGGALLFGGSQISIAAPKAKLIAFWNDSEPSSKLPVNHSKWQEILESYVVTDHPSGVNRFDYDRVSTSDHNKLKSYISDMESVDPRQLNLQNQKAFWLNLYNAKVVEMILESKSGAVRDISGIWKKKILTVTHQKMSLNDIEHGVLRPIFNDPRIHFGITPATIGSGDILPVAFTGENVEQLLEENTKDFFSKSKERFAIRESSLVISSIFKWYKKDFGSSATNIKAFIKKYVDEDVQQQIDTVSKLSYDYDWSLNRP